MDAIPAKNRIEPRMRESKAVGMMNVGENAMSWSGIRSPGMITGDELHDSMDNIVRKRSKGRHVVRTRTLTEDGRHRRG